MVRKTDSKSEKSALATRKPQDREKNVGALALTTKIDTGAQTASSSETIERNTESEFRDSRIPVGLSLSENLGPLPRSLVDTLAPNVPVLDQESYLAKYAIDRYEIIDKPYQAMIKQVSELNDQFRQLISNLKDLKDENEKGKEEIVILQKKLTEFVDVAAKKESGLTQEIHDIRKALSAEEAHDMEDHNALDASYEQVKKEQEARANLEKQVLVLQLALSSSGRYIEQLKKESSKLSDQLETETTRSAALTTEVTGLSSKIEILENDTAALKKELVHTAEELKEAMGKSGNKNRSMGVSDGDWPFSDEVPFPHDPTFPPQLQETLRESMGMLKTALGKYQ